MYDESGDFYGALAEKLNINIELLNLIQPVVGEDTGSSWDEWHYGYYFEFPTLDEINKDVRDQILETSLPLGEKIYLSDGEISDTKADPLGWRSETLEIEYYQRNILPQGKILKEFESIKNKVHINSDDLIRKALIFSVFSLTESYVKSYTWGKIPDLEKNILDDKLRKIVFDSLDYKISRESDRNNILSNLSLKSLGNIPHWNIRNALSHDIGAVKVSGNLLSGKDLKNKDFSEDIFDLLASLQEYVQKLPSNLSE